MMYYMLIWYHITIDRHIMRRLKYCSITFHKYAYKIMRTERLRVHISEFKLGIWIFAKIPHHSIHHFWWLKRHMCRTIDVKIPQVCLRQMGQLHDVLDNNLECGRQHISQTCQIRREPFYNYWISTRQVHDGDVKWPSLRVKLPVNRVFVWQFAPTDSKETSKVRVIVPLCGKSTRVRWIPRQKGTVTRKILPFDDVIMSPEGHARNKQCCRGYHHNKPGIILGMGSANERRCYIVTTCLIGSGQTQTDPCNHVCQDSAT